MPEKHVLFRSLSRSQIYQDYEQAYTDSTELPLTLRAPEIRRPALHGKPHENPFCALLAQSSRACAACLEVQNRLCANPAATGPVSGTCFAGLCDTVVPVRLGERLVGYLQTGQVALQAPSAAQFKKITARLVEWGTKVDLGRLEDAYLHSRVLRPKQYSAMVRLLEIFAQHLASVANQLNIQQQENEPPLIRRARAYIAGHQADDVKLEQVAGALHVSTFYFCKMFKKATGLTFTDYLGRVRVEKAKLQLLNPNLRVSEIAYEVGFGSLTHFNRVFREIVGQSPSDYRDSLPKPLREQS